MIQPDLVGTITLTSGSTAFTWTGTSLVAAAIQAGDEIRLPGKAMVLTIATVTSATEGTLTDNCPAAATGSGQAARVRYQSDLSRVAAQTRQLIELLSGKGFFKYDAVGSLAERDDYDTRPQGFAYLNIDTDPMELYVKASDDSGDWAGPVSYATGPTGPAPNMAVGATDTGAAGTDANVTIDGTNPNYTLNFTIPRGDAGAQGPIGPAGFRVSAVGELADRTTHDAEDAGFSFVATDGDGVSITEPVVFVKLSSASADWSDAVPFGASAIGSMAESVYDPDDIAMDVFGGGLRLPTRSAIADISVASGVDYIQTAGYAAVGDGGAALYKRVVSQPSHPGKVQSADGTWWELVNETVTPAMFGAAGDGSADDTSAVTNAIAIGRALNWGGAGKIYRITNNITRTLARDLLWEAAGATILLDSPASVQSAIMLNCGGRNVTIIGALTLDCQQKAFIGFFFQNSSTTTYGDFFASNLKVRNIYRASTAFTGGDGIWVRGGFRNVYFERPDIRNVLMATGAGVPGSQGISGISVTAMTLAPQEVTIVHPYIDGVYSEDAAYFVDQDGIRVFGPEDDGTSVLSPSHFSLIGGKIKNCGGRSVKSQMEFGHINGTHFVRDSSGISALARVGTMPEIDFQVGGGIIENIECKYAGSSPHRIVQLTGSRQATPIRLGASAKVDGIRISRSGSNNLCALVHVSPYYMRSGIIDIRNITQADLGLLSDNAIQINDQADNSAILIINLENIHARVNPAGPFVFARCTRTVGTTHFVGRNIYATQAGTDFVLAGAGAVTETLEGKNINVS